MTPIPSFVPADPPIFHLRNINAVRAPNTGRLGGLSAAPVYGESHNFVAYRPQVSTYTSTSPRALSTNSPKRERSRFEIEDCIDGYLHT